MSSPKQTGRKLLVDLREGKVPVLSLALVPLLVVLLQFLVPPPTCRVLVSARVRIGEGAEQDAPARRPEALDIRRASGSFDPVPVVLVVLVLILWMLAARLVLDEEGG